MDFTSNKGCFLINNHILYIYYEQMVYRSTYFELYTIVLIPIHSPIAY